MSAEAAPRRWTTWRPDRTATIGAACFGVLFGVTWIIQATATAQIRQIRAETAGAREQLLKRLDALQATLDRSGPASTADRDADLAAESGRKALAGKRWGVGQVYMTNAISQAPRNIKHLKDYTSAVLTHRDAPEAALDELAAILQMAACHVAPDDVSTVITLIDRVGKARDRARPGAPTEAATNEDPPASDSLDAEWRRLQAVATDISKDPVQLTGHLRALDACAAALDEQGNATAEQTRAVAEQIRRWSEIAQASKNAGYIDQCLAKLSDKDIAATTTTDRLVAIVQAAEAVLPSFWGIPAGTLPDELQEKIKNYPAQIRGRVDRISTKKSDELVARIDAILKTIDPKKSSPSRLEPLCIEIETRVKEAQVLAAQLPSPDKILASQVRIEEITRFLQKCRGEQYNRYQTDVINRCNETFKLYMTYKTGLSQTDAMEVFHKGNLASIDQTLLTPEVSRLYNDITGKLMSELGPENLVKIESEMSNSSKVKLENF